MTTTSKRSSAQQLGDDHIQTSHGCCLKQKTLHLYTEPSQSKMQSQVHTASHQSFTKAKTSLAFLNTRFFLLWARGLLLYQLTVSTNLREKHCIFHCKHTIFIVKRVLIAIDLSSLKLKDHSLTLNNGNQTSLAFQMEDTNIRIKMEILGDLPSYKISCVK